MPSWVSVEHRRRAEQHAGDHVRARAELRQQALADDLGGDDDRRRQRQEAEAGLDRREAERALHVVRQEQEEREHRDAGDADPGERATAGAVGEDAQRQQRVGDAALDEEERAEQDDRGGEHDDRDRVTPGVRLGVREAVDEREQAARREQRARDVDARAGRLRLVGQQAERGDGGRQREQQVHVQAPAPGQDLGEDAAEQQADGRAGAGDRAEDAERLAALDRGR